MMTMKYHISLVVFVLLLVSQGFAQTNCADALDRAKENYELGLFENVIKGLNQCLPSITNTKGVVEAHKILAYTYVAIDSIDEAQNEIATIIDLKPDYESELEAPFLFSIALDEMKIQMAGKVTSSVSKKVEKIELAPASIEIITEEEILRRGYRSLEELFHDISGFDITSTKGEQYTLLYQRGYRSDLGDRTLVLINGNEDNGLYTNEAHITRQYPLSSIERVEVIHGPATTMYGANAFLGVINIVTKDAYQLVAKGNSMGINAHTGMGTWNTQMYDVTVAGRFRKIGFTLTGRSFTSDEMDLSEYPDFNFEVNDDKDNGFRYKDYSRKLRFSKTEQPDSFENLQLKDPNGDYHYVSGDSVLPTQMAFRKARSLDSQAHENPIYKQIDKGSVQDEAINLGYRNPTENLYLSGKLNINKLNVGFQLWQKKEGQGGLVTDRSFGYGKAPASGRNLTSWHIRQLTVYSKYDTRISEKVFMSNYTTFKDFAHFPNLSQTLYQGYINGSLGLSNLIDNDEPLWSRQQLYLKSKQVKNELKVSVNFNSRFDLVSGFDIRFGAIPQKILELENSTVVGSAHINARLKDPIIGGNVVHSNEFGLYTQGAYLISDNLRASFGIRGDYNSARDQLVFTQRSSAITPSAGDISRFGYGLQVNPRLALIYNPQKFVFKAIYASAFLNPSNFQRFGTSANRTLGDTLNIERVKNIDLAGRYNLGRGSYIEVIAFGASYSQLIRSILNSSDDLQFENAGKTRIIGLQTNGKYSLENGGFYANLSLTRPMVVRPTNRAIAPYRVGDIAHQRVNLGAYVYLFKEVLTADLRMNHVGARPTGIETTVINNRLSSIDAYNIFDLAITLNGNAFSRLSQSTLQGLSVQLVANNLLNTEYFHPGARAADGLILASSIPQERRHFFIKLQYQW